jgi:hypothetical protein
MATPEVFLQSDDLVSDPELRRAAAKTLKGFCATYLAHHFPLTPSDFFDEMAAALQDFDEKLQPGTHRTIQTAPIALPKSG